jgi:hypothetical protein
MSRVVILLLPSLKTSLSLLEIQCLVSTMPTHAKHSLLLRPSQAFLGFLQMTVPSITQQKGYPLLWRRDIHCYGEGISIAMEKGYPLLWPHSTCHHWCIGAAHMCTIEFIARNGLWVLVNIFKFVVAH